MNDIIKAAVIGGDMRQGYIVNELTDAGFEVSAYGVSGDCPNICETLTDALAGADIAVLPYPISPDGTYLNAICRSCNIRLEELFKEIYDRGIRTVIGGGFKPSITALAKRYELKIFDYGLSETVLTKNALCTAEGALEIAMREMPINIHGSKCAVLGYGRIGKLLASRLRALGAKTVVYARREESQALAECDGVEAKGVEFLGYGCHDYDIFFNTVPSLMLDKNVLGGLKKDCLIIDLASSPGGVDFTEVKKLGIKAIWALSLPGKYSPKSAAKIICEEMIKYLKNGEANIK